MLLLFSCLVLLFALKSIQKLFTYIPYRKQEKEVIENLTFEMERRGRGTRSLRMPELRSV